MEPVSSWVLVEFITTTGTQAQLFCSCSVPAWTGIGAAPSGVKGSRFRPPPTWPWRGAGHRAHAASPNSQFPVLHPRSNKKFGGLKPESWGIPTVVQWLANPTRDHKVAGLIPGVGPQLQLRLDPSPGNLHMLREQPRKGKKTKKKTKQNKKHLSVGPWVGLRSHFPLAQYTHSWMHPNLKPDHASDLRRLGGKSG